MKQILQENRRTKILVQRGVMQGMHGIGGEMHLVVISGCKGKDAGLYSVTLHNCVTSGASLSVKEAQVRFMSEHCPSVLFSFSFLL